MKLLKSIDNLSNSLYFLPNLLELNFECIFYLLLDGDIREEGICSICVNFKYITKLEKLNLRGIYY